MTLTQLLRFCVRTVIHDKFGNFCTKAVLIYFKAVSKLRLVGTEEKHETAVIVAAIWVSEYEAGMPTTQP
jgi:hypothetical protein